MLCLALALISGCRATIPPRIPVYIGDGFGGADGRLTDGTISYKAPTELKNYWMTDQESMAKYSAWCHGVKPELVWEQMESIRADIEAHK